MKTCIKCNVEKTLDEYNVVDPKTMRRNNACKACKSEYNKRLEVKNKDRRRKQKEIYWEKIKNSVKEKRALYMRNKRITDEQFRIANNMRTILSYLITGRQMTTSKDFGGTREEIRNHLESLFYENMSWDNYGKWEVDHIRPVSSFNQCDDSDLKTCWHYSNIQPIWKKENRQKWKHTS